MPDIDVARFLEEGMKAQRENVRKAAREDIARDIRENPWRCDACSHLDERTRVYELPGEFRLVRLQLCSECCAQHPWAKPVEEENPCQP